MALWPEDGMGDAWGESMAVVVWLEDQRAGSAELSGGKAVGLHRLMRCGLTVPNGFVLTVEAFKRAMGAARFDELLQRRLGAIDPEDRSRLAAMSGEVQESIRSMPLPGDIEEAITKAYRQLCPRDEPVAVRSSATAEDTLTASFAGQQETYLGVRGAERIIARVRDCWASAFSERALAYRHRHGVDHTSVSVAVVIQRLVAADKAGVMFTVHPVTHRHEVVVVEACWGLGEALVSGHVTPDHYVLAKQTGAVIERKVFPKLEMLVWDPDGEGTLHLPVPAGYREVAVLTDVELAELAGLARIIEERFARPQDVEWAIGDGALYVLQARPITTLTSAT